MPATESARKKTLQKPCSAPTVADAIDATSAFFQHLSDAVLPIARVANDPQGQLGVSFSCFGRCFWSTSEQFQLYPFEALGSTNSMDKVSLKELGRFAVLALEGSPSNDSQAWTASMEAGAMAPSLPKVLVCCAARHQTSLMILADQLRQLHVL